MQPGRSLARSLARHVGKTFLHIHERSFLSWFLEGTCPPPTPPHHHHHYIHIVHSRLLIHLLVIIETVFHHFKSVKGNVYKDGRGVEFRSRVLALLAEYLSLHMHVLSARFAPSHFGRQPASGARHIHTYMHRPVNLTKRTRNPS